MEPTQHRLLTTDEAAEYLGLPIPTIRKFVRRGELTNVSPHRHMRISTADLDALRERIPIEGVDWLSCTTVGEVCGVDRTTITAAAKGHLSEWAAWGLANSGRQVWLLRADMLDDIIEHYESTRRTQVKVRMIDGERHATCTRCHTPKPLDSFYRSSRTVLGVQSICKECARKRTAKYRERQRDEVLERGKACHQRRRDWVKKAGAEAHRRYEKDAIIKAVDFWRVVDENYGEITNRELGARAGVHEDMVRRAKTGKITVALADRLLTGIEMTHLLDEIVEPPGLDGWSRDRRNCRGCGRCDRLHSSRGYCTTCISYVKRGIDPQFVTGWCKDPSVPACKMCGSTERRHYGRGLCTRCINKAKKQSLLDQYPPLYPAISRDVQGRWDRGDAIGGEPDA